MTIKQQIFVRKYLDFRNATKAVMEIYDTANRNSAAVIGCKLLRKANIKSEIEREIEATGVLSMSRIEMIKSIINDQKIKDKIGMIRFFLEISENNYPLYPSLILRK